MLNSMTGYGRAEYKDGEVSLYVEIRSINNRFLKLTSRLPEAFIAYQEQLERPIKERVFRGSVHMDVEYRPLIETPEYSVNLETLKGYYRSLQRLREELGPEGDVPIASLFSLPGICERTKNQGRDVEEHVPVLGGLVKTALNHLLEMRTQEGRALEEDIMRHKMEIEGLLAGLERKAPEVVSSYRDRLRKRVSSLLQETNVELSDSDLAREVAFFAERSDITEEITRMRSHLQQMEETIKEGGPVGRRLEFIVQEMFREANTMGSKVCDGDMLKDIIDIKLEVERIKEQSFNVE